MNFDEDRFREKVESIEAGKPDCLTVHFKSGRTKEISYTPDQVEMMKKLYPYVRDKQNFNKVIDSLFSTVYKDEMYKFIKEYHQTNK